MDYPKITVNEIDEVLVGEALRCYYCDKMLLDGTNAETFQEFYMLEDGDACLTCATSIAAEIEAEEAEKERRLPIEISERLGRLRITSQFPQFDESRWYSPSPEEFEMGTRGYTRKGHVAMLRHECTNYDELISDLELNSPADSELYIAIRQAVDRLIGIELNDQDLIDGYG